MDPDSNDPVPLISKLKAPSQPSEKENVPESGTVAVVPKDDPDCNDLPPNEQADPEAIVYRLVINEEEQYSIWPAEKEIPSGWRKFTSQTGTMDEMKALVTQHWTDMRPLSLRKEMSEWPEEEIFSGLNPEAVKMIEEWRAKDSEWDGVDQFRKAQPPNALVKKLMVRDQPLVVIRYKDPKTGQPDLEQLRRAAGELGVVLVKFTQTDGGTELGASLFANDGTLDTKRFVWSDQDGTLTVTGRCKLDYCPISVHATINLKTYTGTGHVEPIDDFEIATKY